MFIVVFRTLDGKGGIFYTLRLQWCDGTYSITSKRWLPVYFQTSFVKPVIIHTERHLREHIRCSGSDMAALNEHLQSFGTLCSHWLLYEHVEGTFNIRLQQWRILLEDILCLRNMLLQRGSLTIQDLIFAPGSITSKALFRLACRKPLQLMPSRSFAWRWYTQTVRLWAHQVNPSVFYPSSCTFYDCARGNTQLQLWSQSPHYHSQSWPKPP